MLSVIIVNWNSKEYVRRCLDSIAANCADISLQTIVLDGGSFDGCGEMIANEFPDVEFVQSRSNLGFGRSNNLAFQRARNEHILLLNPDTELKPGAVQAMLAALRQLPDAGIIGPRLLNSDGSLQKSCVQSLPGPWNQFLDSELCRRAFPNSGLWGNAKAFASTVPVTVEAVSGACMLMRSETFRRVNGFSPEYFMYGEDMDLCAKVQALGLSVYHVPTAEVIHHGGGCSRAVSQSSAIWMRRSIHQFIRTHRGRLAATAYRLLMGVSSLVRLAVLAPACLVAHAGKRPARRQSWQKWLAILRWCAGLEQTEPGRA